MRYAIVTRRPACDTDVVDIHGQSGVWIATRHAKTDSELDAILVRWQVDATRVTVSG